MDEYYTTPPTPFPFIYIAHHTNWYFGLTKNAVKSNEMDNQN